MSFFNPLVLLLLAPMGGLIVVMYILKLRRRDVVVSSTYLWRQVIRDVQANAPFQKLRKNLLMFLQIAAVALVVFALSRPFWRTTGLGGRSVAIIVDTSASMLAKDVGRSRIDEAKRQARAIVDGMKPQDVMMVLAAGARPLAMTGFTADRAELARAIDSLEARETSTNMRDAVNLAGALVSSRSAAQIDILSDGGFPPVTNVNLNKARVAFHPIGKASHNVGITAVDYRRSLTGDNTVEVFVTAHNFDDRPRTFNVELQHDGATVDAHEVKLKAGEENPDIFELPEPAVPLTLNVSLDAKDDLAADNRAAIVVSPRRALKALLVTDENVFLENAVRAAPNVELTTRKLSQFVSTAGFDLVIFDGAAPATLPQGNYLFVQCGSNQSPAVAEGSAENQSIVDANRAHPVLKYVDFGTNRWTSMAAGKPAGWGQEIATGESGAAVVAGEKGKMRAVWTGFRLDLAHGPFPLTVSYPIFVLNALRWLAHADDADSAQVRTGEAVTFDAPPSAARLTVVKPDGSKSEVTVSARGGAVFDGTDEVGVYIVEGAGGYRRAFAANLADYVESDIRPKAQPELTTGGPAEVGHRVTVARDLWPWLAALLLALLAFEWWAFHRRVFVTS